MSTKSTRQDSTNSKNGHRAIPHEDGMHVELYLVPHVVPEKAATVVRHATGRMSGTARFEGRPSNYASSSTITPT